MKMVMFFFGSTKQVGQFLLLHGKDANNRLAHVVRPSSPLMTKDITRSSLLVCPAVADQSDAARKALPHVGHW